MNITYKRNENSVSDVEIVVEKEKVKILTKEKLKDLSENISLKGFRKGKVPMHIISGIAKQESEEELAKQIAIQYLSEYKEIHKIKSYPGIFVTECKEENDDFLIKIKSNDFDLIDLDLKEAEILEKYEVESPSNDEIEYYLKPIAFIKEAFNEVDSVKSAFSVFSGELFIEIEEKKIVIESLFFCRPTLEDMESDQVKNAKIGSTLSFSINNIPNLRKKIVKELNKIKISTDKIPENFSLLISKIEDVDTSQVTPSELARMLKLDFDDLSIDELENTDENRYKFAKLYVEKTINKKVEDDIKQKIFDFFIQKYKKNISEDSLSQFVKFENTNRFLRLANLSVEEIMKDEKIRNFYEIAMTVIAIAYSYEEIFNVNVEKLKNDESVGIAMAPFIKAYSTLQNQYNYKGSVEEFMNIPENTRMAPLVVKRNILIVNFVNYVLKNVNFKVKQISFSEFTKNNDKKTSNQPLLLQSNDYYNNISNDLTFTESIYGNKE